MSELGRAFAMFPRGVGVQTRTNAAVSARFVKQRNVFGRLSQLRRLSSYSRTPRRTQASPVRARTIAKRVRGPVSFRVFSRTRKKLREAENSRAVSRATPDRTSRIAV